MSESYSPYIVILMAISAMFWPFWLTILIFVVASFALPTFYTGLLILFIMEAVYGIEGVKIFPIYGLISIGGIVGYALITFLKQKIILQRR